MNFHDRGVLKTDDYRKQREKNEHKCDQHAALENERLINFPQTTCIQDPLCIQ